MPYIPGNRRVDVLNKGAKTAGELNYLISAHIHLFVGANGLKYDTINTVIGVLEAAKLEFYRTVAGPYEEQKRRENHGVSKLDDIHPEEKGTIQ